MSPTAKPSDPILTGLTLLATRIFDAPVSVITAVEESGVRIIASTGWPGPDQFPHCHSYCERVVSTARPLVIHDPSGSFKGMQFYAGHPLLSASGKALGSIAAADVKLRQPTPDQLHSLSLLAAQAAARLETLQQHQHRLATLAHEVRTPLNGILGAADILRRLLDSPAQIEILDALRGSGQVLLEILNHALSSPHSQPPVQKPFHLPQTLTLLTRNFAPLAAKCHLNLRCHIDPSLPETVLGDPLQLHQILQNLIGNALKFTPPGGEVSLTAQPAHLPGQFLFLISDTGPGIPADLLHRIFDPHVQGPTSQFRNADGSGLGLAIARSLAVSLGGELTLSSPPGQGVTARLQLPLLMPATPPPGLRILIVEDDPVNQFVATRLIEMLNGEAHCARDGFAALARLESESFDAVLMDCLMPGLDGYDTTRRIRASGSNIPILALTGQDSALDAQACLACGMNSVLTKPLDPILLQHSLAVALQSHTGSEGSSIARRDREIPAADESNERRRL